LNDEDKELEILKAKRLAEMQKNSHFKKNKRNLIRNQKLQKNTSLQEIML